MAQKTELQRLRDEAKSMGLSAAGGLKALQKRIAEAKEDEKVVPTPKRKPTQHSELTAEEQKAKRSAAAKKAIETMRANGKLPPAREKEPVDPALSARAKKAWETRRAAQATAAK